MDEMEQVRELSTVNEQESGEALEVEAERNTA